MACKENKPCTEKNCSCPVDIGTECWFYTGDDLECSGIKKGTIGTELIQQLDQFICDKFAEVAGYFNLINIGDGAEVYKGLDLAGRKEIRSFTKVGNLLTIVQNINDIQLSIDEDALLIFLQDNTAVAQNYSVANVGIGTSLYKGNTTTPGNTQFDIKKINTVSLNITDNGDDITIDSNIYTVQNLGAEGSSVYAGDTPTVGGIQFNLKKIKSDTLAVTEDADNIIIETSIFELQDFIVDSRFSGEVYEERGTYAKPFKDLDSAIVAYIGTGTRNSPQYGGNRILCTGRQEHNFTQNLSISGLILEVEEGTTITYTGGDIYLIDFRTLQSSLGGYAGQTKNIFIEIKGAGRLIVSQLLAYIVNSGDTVGSPNRYNNVFTIHGTTLISLYKESQFVSGIKRSDGSPWITNTYLATFYVGGVEEAMIVSEGLSVTDPVADNAGRGNVVITNSNIYCISQQIIEINSGYVKIENSAMSNNYSSRIIIDPLILIGDTITETPIGSYTLPSYKPSLCLVEVNGVGTCDIFKGVLSKGFDITQSEAWFKLSSSDSKLYIDSVENQPTDGGILAENFISTGIYEPTIKIKDTKFPREILNNIIQTTVNPFIKAEINNNNFVKSPPNNIDLTMDNNITVINVFNKKVKESLQIYNSRTVAMSAGLTRGNIFLNRKALSVTDMLKNNEYQILTLGSTSNWVGMGATAATVGLDFIYNGTPPVGSGGTVYSHKRDIVV